MADVLFTNVRIFDGGGDTPFTGEVLVQGNRISRVTRTGVGARPLPVAGGYFQLVDYSAVSDLDDQAFCRWLTVEHGVATIPLSPFYRDPPPGQRLARLCFAKSEATLDAAIARLQKL